MNSGRAAQRGGVANEAQIFPCRLNGAADGPVSGVSLVVTSEVFVASGTISFVVSCVIGFIFVMLFFNGYYFELFLIMVCNMLLARHYLYTYTNFPRA